MSGFERTESACLTSLLPCAPGQMTTWGIVGLVELGEEGGLER